VPHNHVRGFISCAQLTASTPHDRNPRHSTPIEILWAFSIYLEAVAILPQLFMLQRTGEAETITTHYLAALGLYRGLYIPNWIYRYFTEDSVDPIAIVAGLVQTCLYADFFYSASYMPTRVRREMEGYSLTRNPSSPSSVPSYPQSTLQSEHERCLSAVEEVNVI